MKDASRRVFLVTQELMALFGKVLDRMGIKARDSIKRQRWRNLLKGIDLSLSHHLICSKGTRMRSSLLKECFN
jgi:hypothetical protein